MSGMEKYIGLDKQRKEMEKSKKGKSFFIKG
jgi:hypothetical protein